MFISASEVHWFRFRNDGHLVLFSVASRSLTVAGLCQHQADTPLLPLLRLVYCTFTAALIHGRR